jgi:hypothetical protein
MSRRRSVQDGAQLWINPNIDFAESLRFPEGEASILDVLETEQHHIGAPRADAEEQRERQPSWPADWMGAFEIFLAVTSPVEV